MLLTATLLSLATCRVVDGDTIACGRERIRLVDIDAPELSQPKCPYERRLAQRAKDRLVILLAPGFEIERTGRDRYNRTLGRVTVDGMDVGEVLVQERLARPWEGRRRSWC